MYGLKQSQHLCGEKLQKTLKNFGFTQLKTGEYILKFKDDRFEVAILVLVDHFVIFSSEMLGIELTEEEWKYLFKLTDLG